MEDTALVNSEAGLFADPRGLYDDGELSPAPAGDSVPGDITDPTATSRQVAGILRAEILAGARLPGSEIESQKELAREYGKSEATMNRALAELARDGLIRVGSGRRTTVLPHYRYRVTVTVRHQDIGQVTDAAIAEVLERLDAAGSGSSGAVADAVPSCAGNVMTIEMLILAADPGRAAMTALNTAAQSAGAGWDFPHATIKAAPKVRP